MFTQGHTWGQKTRSVYRAMPEAGWTKMGWDGADSSVSLEKGGGGQSTSLKLMELEDLGAKVNAVE